MNFCTFDNNYVQVMVIIRLVVDLLAKEIKVMMPDLQLVILLLLDNLILEIEYFLSVKLTYILLLYNNCTGIVGNNQEAVDGFLGEENRDVVMPHFDQNQPANGLQQGNQQLGRRNNLHEREDFNQYGNFNEPVRRANDTQNPAAPENPNNNFRQNNNRQHRCKQLI